MSIPQHTDNTLTWRDVSVAAITIGGYVTHISCVDAHDVGATTPTCRTRLGPESPGSSSPSIRAAVSRARPSGGASTSTPPCMCCAPGARDGICRTTSPSADPQRTTTSYADAAPAPDLHSDRHTRRGPHPISPPKTAHGSRGGLILGQGVPGGRPPRVRRREEGRRGQTPRPRRQRRKSGRCRRYRGQRAGPDRLPRLLRQAKRIAPTTAQASPPFLAAPCSSGWTRATPAQPLTPPPPRPQSPSTSWPGRNPAAGSSCSHADGRSNAPTAGSTTVVAWTATTKSPSAAHEGFQILSQIALLLRRLDRSQLFDTL